MLVNCAGIGLLAPTVGPEGPHDINNFERVVAVNLLGSFNCARLAAAAMTQLTPNEEGERGVIIHTTSILATDGQAGRVAYSASKSGVMGMVLPMARDLARFGIRCVAIAPGMFDTPMIEQLPATMRERLVATVPFPSRLGRPAEFARMVQAVCENTMLNGTVIRLDGAARMPGTRPR